eukprot:g5691.t1
MEEVRIDPVTNAPYTREEFVQYYGDTKEWDKAKDTATFRDPTAEHHSSYESFDGAAELERAKLLPPPGPSWCCCGFFILLLLLTSAVFFSCSLEVVEVIPGPEEHCLIPSLNLSNSTVTVVYIAALSASFSFLLCACCQQRQEGKLSTATKPLGPAEEHLTDALMINRMRKPYYAEASSGASTRLSNLLMLSERTLRFIARWQDGQTDKFRARGVNIMGRETDYASMEGIKAKETPPLYHGRASPKGKKAVKQILKDVWNVSSKDLPGISRACYQAILDIEYWERHDGTHWQMAKHVLESFGLFTLHAPEYIKAVDKLIQSGNGNELVGSACCFPLCCFPCCDFGSIQWHVAFHVNQHKVLLNPYPSTLALMDSWAQVCHERGVGILVNDVPLIPFIEEFEAKYGKGRALSTDTATEKRSGIDYLESETATKKRSGIDLDTMNLESFDSEKASHKVSTFPI